MAGYGFRSELAAHPRMAQALGVEVLSVRRVEAHISPDKRLAVSENDAVAFASNAVNVGDAVILNQASTTLRQQLERRGYRVLERPLLEFLKAGGAAKCVRLRRDETTAPADGEAQSALISRRQN